MKTNRIAATLVLSLLSAATFAQTPAATNQVPGPGVHKAKIDVAPQHATVMKQTKKDQRKAAMATMTPDERQAFKADRKAKKAAKLASMTPEQRQAHDARKAQKKAERLKMKSK